MSEGYGEAIAWGALSVVNAIATGKGAALAINMYTKARVELLEDSSILECRIDAEGAEGESTKLIEECFREVIGRFGLDYGARIVTESNIPIAVGLKSSSAAANAVVLATLSAIGKRVEMLEAVRMGVRAAIRAGVTITGAFDDACASALGGVVVTENEQMKLVRRMKIPEEWRFLILIPPRKIYTSSIDADTLRRRIGRVAIHPWELALDGKIEDAITVNGMLYAASLGYGLKEILSALDAGALAAGLSGKGPAVYAIYEKDDEKTASRIREAWSRFDGRIVEVEGMNRGAWVMR